MFSFYNFFWLFTAFIFPLLTKRFLYPSNLKVDNPSPLTYLTVNLSFSTGIFATILKTAKVIPIHKKDSKREVPNYRPISLLSNIDQIFEKLKHSRLIEFLEERQILYYKQFGFRKDFSTNHAILDLLEIIQKALDDGQIACGIFIDLVKAFDTVSHDILLEN